MKEPLTPTRGRNNVAEIKYGTTSAQREALRYVTKQNAILLKIPSGKTKRSTPDKG